MGAQKRSKKQMIKECLEAIEAYNIKFVTHLEPYIPFSISLFYDYELQKNEDIKKAIDKNRITKKNEMLDRWIENDNNAALQISAYKLMSDDKEHSKLSGYKHEVKADVKQVVDFDFERIDDED